MHCKTMNGFNAIQQKRSIFKNIKAPTHAEVQQAGIGSDYGRLVLCGATNEVSVANGLTTGDSLGMVRSELLRLYNRMVAAAITPIAVTNAIMLPTADEAAMKRIIMEISDVATELGVDVLAGDTKASDAFAKAAVALTMYGVGAGLPGANIATAKDVVMCGQTGVLGTYLVAKGHKEELLKRYSVEYIATAERFDRLVKLDANVGEIAKTHGAVQAHCVSRSGVHGAIWELAERNDCGICVSHDAMPIMQETIEVCEFLGENPYKIDGCGAVLYICEDGAKLVDALYAAGFEAAVIGRLIDEKKRVIVHDGEESHLTPR